MKVILKQDVARIGKRFDIVEVPDGYALNQLIPKRMAEPATPANLRQVQQRASRVATQQAISGEQFAALCTKATETSVVLSGLKVNEQGHLFQAVHAADVVKAAAAAGMTILPEMITFAEPIKSVGKHTVALTHADQTCSLTLQVTA